MFRNCMVGSKSSLGVVSNVLFKQSFVSMTNIRYKLQHHTFNCRDRKSRLRSRFSCCLSVGTCVFRNRHFHSSNQFFQGYTDKDYYQILNVQEKATQTEIKKAYYLLAKKYHPDRTKSKEDKLKFNEITEAYDILGKEDTRAKYDNFGGQQTSDIYNPYPENPEDLFRNVEHFFHSVANETREMRQRKSKRPRQGEDINVQVSLLFMEAIRGCTKTTEYHTKSVCVSCRGSGSMVNSSPITCPICRGRGQAPDGDERFYLKANAICWKCAGDGVIVSNPCVACRGQGYKKKKRIVHLEIPPGVESGTILELSEQGECGLNGAPHGSLFVELLLSRNDYFARNKLDFLSRELVDFSNLALGRTITIEGIRGDLKVEIPAGTQNGERIVIQNEGVEDLYSNKRGNHYVEMIVTIPKDLTIKQQKLMEKYSLSMDNPEDFVQENGIWNRLKSFLNI